MNRATAQMYTHGLLTAGRGTTLEVTGRRSGRPVSLPVVVADYQGSRYLVSMLGAESNWVRNIRAASGEATLVQHGRHPVRLIEIPVDQRAPVLRRYLDVAPGARPLAEMTAIEADLHRLVRLRRDDVAAVDPRHTASARNLLHYLGLRGRDIRPAQVALARRGLSSLGRCEPHVAATVRAVTANLRGAPATSAANPPESYATCVSLPRSAWTVSSSRPTPCFTHVSAISASASGPDSRSASIHPTTYLLNTSRMTYR